MTSKDLRITLRLTAQDSKRLQQLADHYAINQASVIRMLLKRAEDELTAELGRKVKRGRSRQTT